MQQLSTICYIDNGSQLLLLYRNKKKNDIHHGKWISVGGKFEAEEDPKSCAIREIKEETGLEAKKLVVLGFFSFRIFTHDGRDWYAFVYRVKEYSGELIDDCDEGQLEWVDYDQVLTKPTWTGDALILKWVLEAKGFFIAKFKYNELGELVDYEVDFLYEGDQS